MEKEDLLTPRIETACFELQDHKFIKDTDGYKNAYKFMNIVEIRKIVDPVLKKHGIRISQAVDSDMIDNQLFAIVTTSFIGHGSRQDHQGKIPFEKLPGMNMPQSVGWHFTYFQRYQLCGLLGIIPEEDTDGAGKQTGNHKNPQEPRERAPRPQNEPNSSFALPDNKTVYEAIFKGPLSDSEKSQLWDNFKKKPENTKGAYWEFIKTRVNFHG